jgi:hypothetical protein
MKAKAFVYALALLSSVASARDQFACDNNFGENLQVLSEKIFVIDVKTRANFGEGDFNGDGLKDRIVLLRLNEATQFRGGVTLLNLSEAFRSNGRESAGQANNANKLSFPNGDTISLGIVQSNISDKKCRKFVIYNTDYFPSSHEARHLSVTVIPVADTASEYGDFQKYISQNFGSEELRYDAIHLNSPSRIALVYWSNGKYVFNGIPDELFPDEE